MTATCEAAASTSRRRRNATVARGSKHAHDALAHALAFTHAHTHTHDTTSTCRRQHAPCTANRCTQTMPRESLHCAYCAQITPLRIRRRACGGGGERLPAASSVLWVEAMRTRRHHTAATSGTTREECIAVTSRAANTHTHTCVCRLRTEIDKWNYLQTTSDRLALAAHQWHHLVVCACGQSAGTSGAFVFFLSPIVAFLCSPQWSLGSGACPAAVLCACAS